MEQKRVHVVLGAEERAAYRAAADREGLTLSAWLRAAARARLEAVGDAGDRSVQALDDFFTACDANEDGQGPEPEWDEHRRVIEQSRRSVPAS